jgi:hypothetical protein
VLAGNTCGRKAKYIQGFGREIKGKRPLVNLGIAARIILKSIVKIRYRRTWTGFIWLRVVSSGRLL